MTATPSWTYRPGLDGVRGLAILLVLLHHYHLPFPQAGRVGVTLFFGLSGYLITGLLLAEQRETGKIGLKAFYIRRARRLLPALFVLIAAVLAVAWLHGDLARAVPAAIATGLYVSNFANSAGLPMGLLQHTWSLAVEEQFYVWWPLAFIGLLAWRPQWAGRITLAAAAAVATFKLCLWLFGIPLYVPFDRADALLAGSAMAIFGFRGLRWLIPPAMVAVAGLIFIPGNPGWILVACAALAAVVAIAADDSVLGWWPLVGLGQISYSVYLWHQPAVREIDRLLPALPQPAALAAYIVVTFTLAYASYRWIEQPFRRSRALRPASGAKQGTAAASPPVPG
jgi:peptidoglycan/LPS O-acetylase OafA/YrhL